MKLKYFWIQSMLITTIPRHLFYFFFWFILTSSVIVHPGKLLVKITLSSNVLFYDAKNGLYIVM